MPPASRPGLRVLDVGSGAGDVAFLAAELVGPEGAVVGVDVDGAALATARARAELLGLQNVKFVEGDVRTAALGDDFDAAVGRLVLMYLEDPAQALRAIAARVRAGGAIAFQELDLDPGIDGRSLPGGTLWDETGRLVIETFVRAGAHVRMGRQLYGAFLAAGLAAPAMCEEALVGGGPDFAAYAWLAGVARTLAPVMQRLGLAGGGSRPRHPRSESATTPSPAVPSSGPRRSSRLESATRPWAVCTRSRTAIRAVPRPDAVVLTVRAKTPSEVNEGGRQMRGYEDGLCASVGVCPDGHRGGGRWPAAQFGFVAATPAPRRIGLERHWSVSKIEQGVGKKVVGHDPPGVGAC